MNVIYTKINKKIYLDRAGQIYKSFDPGNQLPTFFIIEELATGYLCSITTNLSDTGVLFFGSESVYVSKAALR